MRKENIKISIGDTNKVMLQLRNVLKQSLYRGIKKPRVEPIKEPKKS